MDEFIPWTVDDSKVGVEAVQSVENAVINRQNNPPITAALNNRAVEDVWSGIKKQSTADVTETDPHRQHQQIQFWQHYPDRKQAIFDKMTLEDFLFRTGAVTDDRDAGSQIAESNRFCPSAGVSSGFPCAANTVPSLPQDWNHYCHNPLEDQPLLQESDAVLAAKRKFRTPSFILPNGSPFYEFADNAVFGPEGFTNALALSPSLSDYPLPSRKRFSSEFVAEKLLDRRQKRMIKNRESAARSRARKQAYTDELEAKVKFLKMENAKLRLQQASQTRPPEENCTKNTKMQCLERRRSI